MTNEEQIEEILFEVHELGIETQMFELVHKLTKQNPYTIKVDIYEKALKTIKSEVKMVYSSE